MYYVCTNIKKKKINYLEVILQSTRAEKHTNTLKRIADRYCLQVSKECAVSYKYLYSGPTVLRSCILLKACY